MYFYAAFLEFGIINDHPVSFFGKQKQGHFGLYLLFMLYLRKKGYYMGLSKILTISISLQRIILQANAHKLRGLKMDLHREVREMVKVDKCSAENMLTGITEY